MALHSSSVVIQVFRSLKIPSCFEKTFYTLLEAEVFTVTAKSTLSEAELHVMGVNHIFSNRFWILGDFEDLDDVGRKAVPIYFG